MPAPALWPTGTCTEALGLALSRPLCHRLCRGDRDLHSLSVPSATGLVPRCPGSSQGRTGYHRLSQCRGAFDAFPYSPGMQPGPKGGRRIARPPTHRVTRRSYHPGRRTRLAPMQAPCRAASHMGAAPFGAPPGQRDDSSGPVSRGPDVGHKFLGRVHACYNCCFIIRMIQHNNCTRAGRVQHYSRHSMPSPAFHAEAPGPCAPGARAPAL